MNSQAKTAAIPCKSFQVQVDSPILAEEKNSGKIDAFHRNLAYIIAIMKLLMVPLLFALFCNMSHSQSSAQQTPAKTRPRLLIAECAEDGFYAFIPDESSRTRIARIGNIDLEAAFTTPDGDNGARFWIARDGKTIFSFTAKDLVASGVWIAVDDDVNPTLGYGYDYIALTYSTGGATGDFRVRVFHLDGDVVTDISKVIDGAVADFKVHHYCKERGNNVTALKWTKGDLLLLTEVYPTGDCGLDLGHTEAYLVSVPDGKIRDHLTLDQLRRYPGVCLENDDGN